MKGALNWNSSICCLGAVFFLFGCRNEDAPAKHSDSEAITKSISTVDAFLLLLDLEGGGIVSSGKASAVHVLAIDDIRAARVALIEESVLDSWVVEGNREAFIKWMHEGFGTSNFPVGSLNVIGIPTEGGIEDVPDNLKVALAAQQMPSVDCRGASIEEVVEYLNKYLGDDYDLKLGEGINDNRKMWIVGRNISALDAISVLREVFGFSVKWNDGAINIIKNK